MPLAVEFAVVCGGFGARGFGIDGGAMALPIRDFGLPFGLSFAFTSPPLSRVSNLFAKKLAVFEKVLMSSMA